MATNFFGQRILLFICVKPKILVQLFKFWADLENFAERQGVLLR